MTKELTPDQARNILVKQLASPKNENKSWLVGEDRTTLYHAAIAKKKTVLLMGERKFEISYRRQKSIAWGDDKGYDSCYVKPVDGFVPCGWFHIDRLKPVK